MTPGRLTLSILFLAAGTLHFIVPYTYTRIVPNYLPHPHFLVLLSGACEFLGGLGLLLNPTRKLAAWGLIALLLAVFPANLQMALDHATLWPHLPAWTLWARLPLQLPLIWWAWNYTR